MGENKMISGDSGIGLTEIPPSEGLGDLILYRDSSGVEIEALIHITAPDFDNLWQEERQNEGMYGTIHYTLKVTDDMIN